MTEPALDDVRGSAPVLSTKDIVLELYRDMKVVRPAVESLVAAGIVTRVELLEQRQRDEDVTSRARGQIVNWSNKAIGLTVLLTNFIVGLIVVVANFTP